jgi:hypothetical protein
MIVLGVDPGEHIGYAKVDFDLPTKKMSVLDFGFQPFGTNSNLAAKFLRATSEGVELFVVEEYIVNPKVYGHDHQGDKGVALRQIGMLEMRSVEIGAELVLQMPTVKPPAYGFLGKKYQRGKKEQHGWDALAHVAYYLVTKRQMHPLSP